MKTKTENDLANEIARVRHGADITASDLANRLMPWMAQRGVDIWCEGFDVAVQLRYDANEARLISAVTNVLGSCVACRTGGCFSGRHCPCEGCDCTEEETP